MAILESDYGVGLSACGVRKESMFIFSQYSWRAYQVRILALSLAIVAFGLDTPAQKSKKTTETTVTGTTITASTTRVEARSESALPPIVISRSSATTETATPLQPVGSVAALYLDPLQGATSSDIVQRALTSNVELSAARLDVERGRARLRQSGLRPNPTIDFEQTTGRLTGSPGERSTSIGVALPLEVGGVRRRRIDLARFELEASEAEIANRERLLAGESLAAYGEALAALRELQITEKLNNLDIETARFVQVRVSEGETAPIDLNLLRVEVDRLRSRRALSEGRVQAALIKLKNLIGMSPDDPLRLREDFAAVSLPASPRSLEATIEVALRSRPDLRLARLNEEVAQAGLQLVRAQNAPSVTASARFMTDRTITDLPEPLPSVAEQNRSLAFGVSIGLPVFNRNQGALTEAGLAITQARRRREFAEGEVRAEVTSAYRRYEAASRAITTFEQGVIGRSNENIKTIRAAYQLGAFSITDLLVQQRQLLDSQREFTEALAERYRSLADLQSAVGVPAKSDASSTSQP